MVEYKLPVEAACTVLLDAAQSAPVLLQSEVLQQLPDLLLRLRGKLLVEYHVQRAALLHPVRDHLEPPGGPHRHELPELLTL